MRDFKLCKAVNITGSTSTDAYREFLETFLESIETQKNTFNAFFNNILNTPQESNNPYIKLFGYSIKEFNKRYPLFKAKIKNPLEEKIIRYY